MALELVSWKDAEGDTEALLVDRDGSSNVVPVCKLLIGGDGVVSAANLLAFGQAAKAASLPVALASDQEDIAAAGTIGIANYTVTISAQKLGSGGSNAPIAGRKWIHVLNLGASRIFLGPTSGVTTATGYPLGAQGSQKFLIRASQDLYAISESSSDVRILEGGA